MFLNKNEIILSKFFKRNAMEFNKIDLFLMTKGKYFETSSLPLIKEMISKLPPEKQAALQFIEPKDPMLMLIVSLFVGCLGIDRFMLGQVGLGVLKLLTFGGCGIWAIVDLFLIMDETKRKNFEELMKITTY